MSNKNEKREEIPIEHYLDMPPEVYMKDRVNGQLSWMSKKSASNKKLYLRYKLCVIIMSVSIPFLVTLISADPRVKYLVALVGVLIAIFEGILSLYEYQNNWVNYRSTAETLKRERYLFSTKTGDYANVDKPFPLFVEKIETILGAENQNWSKYSSDEAKIPKDQNG